MSEKASTKRTKTAGNGAPRREAPLRTNPAFDDWLEKKLHHIFDAVAVEPLPKDLLKLLEKLDEAAPAKKEKA